MPSGIGDHPLGNNIEFHPALRESQRFGFIWTRACVLLDVRNNFHIDFKQLSARRQTIDSQELKELAQSVAV